MDKKELKNQYKQFRPEMGVFAIRDADGRIRFLECASNLKARINREIFQLNAGSHKDRALQSEWNTKGESAFAVEILETLSYSEDLSKTDYSEELAILKQLWLEKLEGEKSI